jgi:cytochrome c-type biogenesis protein CcmF
LDELGHFALALACALAAAQAVLPLWGAQVRDARLMATAPALALGQLIALAASCGALVYAYVGSDFSVLSVVQNSHTMKPWLYKVTATWGNHEGSILLWGLTLALCGGAVALFGGGLPAALRARVIGVLGLTSVGFLLFALLTSNPFLRVWPMPPDGQGLNPVLQDPGLAFHPPILYAGYVGFAVPFAFAVAALIEGRVDAAWGRWVRPWALASWCFLTGGIALGSWWAYYTLGWGGYWFWDPVENASLLPWLTGTALLHSAVVVEKREALRVWTVLLAIGTFSLSLSGTFLVRSGILNSVHAFATDPGRGVFILGLLALLIGGALVLFAWRAPLLTSGGLFAPVSREGALVLNNVLLCAIAAVVGVGTVYPLFADLLLGVKLSVGPPFFHATVLPLALPVAGAMTIGPLLPWKRARLLPVLTRLWWVGLAAAVAGGVGLYGAAVLPALGFAAAIWMILGGLADPLLRAQVGRVSPRASLARLAGLRLSVWGGTLGHAGLGLTIAGICGMSLAVDGVVLLHPGEAAMLDGYQWRLVSLVDETGPNYAARVATVAISRDGRPVVTLNPERRTFPLQRQTTAGAAIHATPLRDLYAVLGEEREGAAVLRLHVNPLAPWIWLGALVMAAGGFLSLLDRRARLGAPARRPAVRPAGSAAA